ncbi:hypothetical protein C8Q76DRAFT_801186 [Earliella scabrosa]|nr:hypothetical protein C8Q76DRAFT_801186 [Earliella scabrosa]
MRFFAVLALTAVASAAHLSKRQAAFPSCANDCLINADFGDCDPLDDSCLCHNQAFVSSVTVCIQRACSGDELASAESAAQQLCEAVGVTLTATPTGTGAPVSSNTETAPAPSETGAGGDNGAVSHGVSALAALAAVGAAALVL